MPGGVDLDFDRIAFELRNDPARYAIPKLDDAPTSPRDRPGGHARGWVLTAIGLVTFSAGGLALVLSHQTLARAHRGHDALAPTPQQTISAPRTEAIAPAPTEAEHSATARRAKPRAEAEERDEAVAPESLLGLADHPPATQPDPRTVPAPTPTTVPTPTPPTVPTPSTTTTTVPTPTPAATSDELPARLTPSAIQRGFAAVRQRVLACKAEAPESATVATVTAVIAPDGTVDESAVEDPLANTPAAACIRKAIEAARFDPFRGEPQTVTYPFAFRSPTSTPSAP
jgi:hypothetical protein